MSVQDRTPGMPDVWHADIASAIHTLSQRRIELTDRVRASVSDDVWRLILQESALDGAVQALWHTRLTEELAAHLPHLAPTIRLLMDHIGETSIESRCTCFSQWDAQTIVSAAEEDLQQPQMAPSAV